MLRCHRSFAGVRPWRLVVGRERLGVVRLVVAAKWRWEASVERRWCHEGRRADGSSEEVGGVRLGHVGVGPVVGVRRQPLGSVRFGPVDGVG